MTFKKEKERFMDVERLIISKLTDKNEISRCWDLGVRPKIFTDLTHGRIYDFIVKYWQREAMDNAPTKQVIEREFPTFSVLDHVEESTPWLVDQLKKRHISNNVQGLMRGVARESVDDPENALSLLFDGAWDLKNAVAERSSRVNLAENMEQRKKRYTDALLTPQDGAPIGFDDIDKHTQGIRPGELACVAAYTKVGKSWTLIHSALAARKKGFTPYVATLEMSVPEFEYRFDALNSGVSYSRLQNRTLDLDELKRLDASRDELAQYGDIFVEQPDRGDRTVNDLVGRARQLGCDFILIDQLSFMNSVKEYDSLTKQYTEIIFDLKSEISSPDRGQIPCFLAVQLNRASVAEEGKRASVSNIAYSAAIEQTADCVYGLYSNKDLKNNDSMIIDILASRRSIQKSWLLEWSLNDYSKLDVRRELNDDE